MPVPAVPVYVWAAALAVALSVPILWYALAVDRVPGRRVGRNLTAHLTPGDVRGLVLARSPFARLVQPILGALARPARRLTPGGMLSSIERRIELAGASWSVERVLIVKLVLGGGLLTGGLLWAFGSGSGLGLVVALSGGLVGYLGPDTVLARRAATRQLKISNELPDMLDQLTICVESGLGFDAALAPSVRARGAAGRHLRPAHLPGVAVPGRRATGEASLPGRGTGDEAPGEGDLPVGVLHPADRVHRRARTCLRSPHDGHPVGSPEHPWFVPGRWITLPE